MFKTDLEYPRKRLLEWYRVKQRDLPWRRSRNPYHIWVSEVMLQQTQVNTVLSYYRRFIKAFPSVERLAAADLQSVLKLWEGLGYYARARNLHRAAQRVVQDFKAKIPDCWAAFRGLPGVGDYIAAAVLSIAFNQPCAVVDGNVKRVLARLQKISAPVNQPQSNRIFKAAADQLLDERQPGTFNQAIMELGALICRPRNPACEACPLNQRCQAYRSRQVPDFPKRKKRVATPLYHIAVGVVFKNNRVLITQRKPEGLLGGLWEFPGGKIKDGESAAAACIREIKEEANLVVEIDQHLTQVKHAYTHFKIIMEVFCCKYVSGRVYLRGPVAFRWIRIDEYQKFPFPRANHKFIPMLKDLQLTSDNGKPWLT
ncbi:MAG: A/G-specific adenine glycosylase [Desulfobacterales bacterium]|jgi:A/G-specific adenine glycosylase